MSLPIGSDDTSLPASAAVLATEENTSSPEPRSARAGEEGSKAVLCSAEECSFASSAEEAPSGNLAPADEVAKVPGRASPIEGGEGKALAEGPVSSLRKDEDSGEMPSVLSPSAEVPAGAKEVQRGGGPGVGDNSMDSGKDEDELPKAVVTLASKGELVSSPAKICTGPSDQESAEDNARGSSADGVPGSASPPDQGDMRKPPANEAPGGISSLDQTGMKEPLADEVPGSVGPSD